MLEVGEGTEEASDLLGAGHDWQFLLLPGKGNVLDHPVPLEADPVEETQSTHGLIEHGPGGLLGLDQKDWIAVDLRGVQPLRRLAEVAGELGDPADLPRAIGFTEEEYFGLDTEATQPKP